MKITFTGRHTEVTGSLKQYAEERLSKMSTYIDDIIDIHTTLSIEKHRHQADISLKSKTGVFIASAETDDMYQSLSQAIDKLEIQVHKKQGRRQASRTRELETVAGE
ncbi:MAG: ribosome-associated translation inhibitor RaiA [Holophagales bacterium]|jgi:putative sigma-54 modulation protein|nr:ribosome-associated translation inhibitor RaiA [Holophagales bacterium]